MQSQTASEAA